MSLNLVSIVPKARRLPPLVTTTEKHQFTNPILIMGSTRPNRARPKPFEKIGNRGTLNVNSATQTTAVNEGRTYRPVYDYDYYDEGDDQLIGKLTAQVRVYPGKRRFFC